LPHDFAGWINLLLPWLIFAATSGFFASRLSRLAPHSICLSGQRAENEHTSTLSYRFAVQNNEDVSLRGRYRLTISILDDGCFLSECQKLFVGRNVLRAQMDETQKILTLEFDELPAYDTWSIECHTDALARTVLVAIDGSGEEDTEPKERESVARTPGAKLLSVPAALSHTRLTLRRDRDTVFEGAAYTPEGRWAVAAWIIALLAYFPRAYSRGPDLWDLVPVGLLSLFCWALWFAMRRPASAISQGYWAETLVGLDERRAEIAKSSAAAAGR
jgi:hypothetical protein